MPNANHVLCNAMGCVYEVPVKQTFCRYHWLSLPKKLRRSILANQEKNQELWLTQVKEAKANLYAQEGGEYASA